MSDAQTLDVVLRALRSLRDDPHGMDVHLLGELAALDGEWFECVASILDYSTRQQLELAKMARQVQSASRAIFERRGLGGPA